MRYYVGKDKNPKQISHEVLLKRALAAAKHVHGSLPWGSILSDCVLTVDWLPALLLEAKPDKSYQIRQNFEVSQKFKLDVAAIRNEIDKTGGRSTGGVQWSL